MSDYFLTQVINYGAPLFALTLFLGALGLPVGASLMVIAVGAFSQQGYFDFWSMSALGLFGVALGDALSYSMGYYGRDWAQTRMSSSPAWKSALAQFNKSAWAAVFFTRFLVTALAIPTNLIAGGSGYPFKRFMLYDMLGEITWLVSYGGLGYLFGSQWEVVNELLSNFGGLALGVVIFVIGARQAFKRQTKRR